MKVAEVLDGLQLNQWQHVVICTRKWLPLGGGYPTNIMSRFGNKEVLSTVIDDNIIKFLVCDPWE